MTTEQIFLIITSVIAIGGTITAAIFARRSSREGNFIQAFDSNIKAFTTRAESAERAAVEARETAQEAKKVAENAAAKYDDLKKAFDKEKLVSATVKSLLRSWFAKLDQEWKKYTDKPMPLPDAEALDWLELTQPSRRTTDVSSSS